MVEILPIPRIPEQLIIASKAGTLVPFIGAGVSVLAGAPNWNGFADATLKQFVKEQNKFSLSQVEQLKHLSPRVKLSIARSLEKTHQTKIDFKRILHPAPNPSLETGTRLYGHLSSLSKTFVTTNYDYWLDYEHPTQTLEPVEDGKKELPLKRRTPIHKVNEFTFDKLCPDTVIHLHGSLDDPDSMVLTTKDYTERYSNDRGDTENLVLTFLENLFKERCVLFIGYGLEELEILEYIIQKSGKAPSTPKSEIRHFILQGFFTHEQLMADAMADYYSKECGIQLLPFSKDQNDWKQLLSVIEDFSTKIPVGKTLLVQDFQDMEALLNG